MKKLFEKNEVTFAVILIVVYVVGSSIMQGISENLGKLYLAEMVFHIVNLFNGYDIVRNIIQIVYAVVVGFMLVFVFYRTGSLIMCIVFHALNNSLTAFSTMDWGESSALNMVMLAVRMVIMVGYTIYIVKFIPQRAES